MSQAGKVGSTVELNAVVRPPCVCGEPWSKHGGCGGYQPSGPIIDYGTIHFRSTDWLANTLYMVESFVKRLRIARMRKA